MQAVDAAKAAAYASYNKAVDKINTNIKEINDKFIKAKKDEAASNKACSESMDKF